MGIKWAECPRRRWPLELLSVGDVGREIGQFVASEWMGLEINLICFQGWRIAKAFPQVPFACTGPRGGPNSLGWVSR